MTILVTAVPDTYGHKSKTPQLVFGSKKEERKKRKRVAAKSRMEKSQVPNTKHLHNFPLSSLKWGKDFHINYMRSSRRSDHSPNTPPCPPPETPSCDDDRRLVSPCYDADGDGGGVKERISAAVVVTEPGAGAEVKSGAREARNRTGCLASSLYRSVVKGGVIEDLNGEMSAADGVKKQRSLRPRRAAVKGKGDSTNVESQEKACGAVIQQAEEINVAKLTRPRRITSDFEGVRKKERKHRVWISLSKDEIEEDIFIMTGSKPSRKPKKWPKPVQDKLDSSFPGLAFVGIYVDEYRRPDAMSK